MPDMLVKLYDLPTGRELLDRLAGQGVVIRHAMPLEKDVVKRWVGGNFPDPAWGAEVEVCFARQPVSCLLAVQGEKLVGFGCYDATCKAFFGPTGVAEPSRGRGIGTALLLSCLHALRSQGYAYGIIGGAGPVDFYAKVVGATPIEGSVPGVYRGMVRE